MREGDAAEDGNKPSIARSLHPRSLSFSFSVSSFPYGTGQCFFSKKLLWRLFSHCGDKPKKKPSANCAKPFFAKFLNMAHFIFRKWGEKKNPRQVCDFKQFFCHFSK
jgi:hypothetical protein